MKEIVVRGDGNCFYRAVSLWNDISTDRNHVNIREQVNHTIASHPEVSEAFCSIPVQCGIICRRARMKGHGQKLLI